MPVFRLPRNISFIKKLPKTFYLKVLETKNKTSEGTWYYVDINGHKLNLLSETDLKKGMLLEMEKESSLLLKIVRIIHHARYNEESVPSDLTNNKPNLNKVNILG